LRRVPNEKIFQAPLVVINNGFTMAAYSDFDILFQDSMRSISGKKEDESLLIFLALYLQSNLAKYFMFHTSANFATERDKVHLDELLRIPFPIFENCILPEANVIFEQLLKKAKQLWHRLKGVHDKLENKNADYELFEQDNVQSGRRESWRKERKQLVDAFQIELNTLIYRYFGLTRQEIMLVEDTVNVFVPSATPKTLQSKTTVTLDSIVSTSVEPYATGGLRIYADVLTTTLNEWARRENSKYRVCSQGSVHKETGLAIIILDLVKNEREYQEFAISDNFMEKVEELHRQESRRVRSLSYQRDIFVIERTKVYIIRPDALINWTRTAALNDAARVFSQIVSLERTTNDRRKKRI
jgi:hypothetical protein